MHDSIEICNGFPGKSLPDLEQGINKLLESQMSNLVVPDGPEHNVPEVFYWLLVG